MGQQTKQDISTAFTELLKEKPFSKITISDITARCGIARMTFYYHFDDIYDMLGWVIEEKLKKAIDANFTADTWMEGYLSVFQACLMDKAFYIKVFPSLDLHRTENYLMGIARSYILGVVEEKLHARALVIGNAEKQMICDIFGYSMVGFFLQWISEGMKEDPAPIVERFAFLLKGTMDSALTHAGEMN